MRQPGGYGGPVAHWWQNRYRYAGPGLDWRYEGILAAYTTLALRQKGRAGANCWKLQLERAASDLIDAQDERGHYPASRFEINPGTLGTPHEAAASLGLVQASAALSDRSRALEAARRNLDALIVALWDERTGGFNDRPGVLGRVPNKLATLAQALLSYSEATGERGYLPYAHAALNDVLRYQLRSGRFQGAIHQYAPDVGRGDGRFFPFYNARCVPPLLLGARLLEDSRFEDAAFSTLDFLRRTMTPAGSWPQIVYESSGRADWPQWFAGGADILFAFLALNVPLPKTALGRLLASQLPSGAFPTAHGFSSQISQRSPGKLPNHRDITPVVGWNDKVFRLLSQLLPEGTSLPPPTTKTFGLPIEVCGQAAFFQETPSAFVISAKTTTFYEWRKQDVWATTVHPHLEVR